MSAVNKIAVAGATGRLGHHVVEVLVHRGYEVVRISRTHGVDVITASGLVAALAGVTGAAGGRSKHPPPPEGLICRASRLRSIVHYGCALA